MSNMVGIDRRITEDIDFMLSRKETNLDEIIRKFDKTFAENKIDEVWFSIGKIEDIRIHDENKDKRLYIWGHFKNIRERIIMDVVPCYDVMPKPTTYTYKCWFNDDSMSIVASSLENIIFEKTLAIYSWGVETTRMKDYFDLFFIYSNLKQDINYDTLVDSLFYTFEVKNETFSFEQMQSLFDEVQNSKLMLDKWLDYCSQMKFAKGINFNDVVSAIKQFFNELYDVWKKKNRP